MTWLGKVKLQMNDIIAIEQRMLEIEQMDKDNLSLDDQFKILEEYNSLWDKASKLNQY